MSDVDEASGTSQPEIRTILVVEDDADVGEFFILALKQETPYQSLLVPNGFEALKLVNTIKPNLFVLDYQLPNMNGIELYDHLHAIQGLEDVPALFMSANLPTGELKKRRVYYIKKPFELEELLQTIEDLLAE
jgi:CheY-like chemotaxis protein